MGKNVITTLSGNKYTLPVFFPDATKAVVRGVDSIDVVNSKTPGILINTLHLADSPGTEAIINAGGAGKYMNWHGAIISDSGGFQVMSLARSQSKNAVTDEGVKFKYNGRKILLTPEKSIEIQSLLKTDLMVVFDDFTPVDASEKEARRTVERTILWAKRCKDKFKDIYKTNKTKREGNEQVPYLIGVAQGGRYANLRKECIKELVNIGFDGIGYGGWPMNEEGKFDKKIAKLIASNTPKDYLLYGLGIGKPDDIVYSVGIGYSIFDCVLPTRDARHSRLYVYDADSIEKIDIRKRKFYSYFVPNKSIHSGDFSPISKACDCLLCTNYSRSYLNHLFKIKDTLAMRLSTIHNLRFYSILMEQLRKSGQAK